MTTLVIDGLEEQLVRELERRAAENGRSIEEEHRAILHQALYSSPPASFKEMLRAMPDGGEDSDFERPLDLGRTDGVFS